MSRNDFSRFAMAPQVDMKRSVFDLSHGIKTSFDVGELIPITRPIEVLPGDEFSIKTAKVLRLQTLITPTFENLNLDVYWFFVPNRLVWTHWRELMGENSDSAWVPQVEYAAPAINSPQNGWNIGTIADYMGIPTGVDNLSVLSLPIRAYALICNEWFRDENLQSPLNIPVTDSDVTGSNGSSYVTDVAKGGKPFIACRYHDYFSSCLPAPLKASDPVYLPLGDDAPVIPKFASGIYETGDTVPSAISYGTISPNQAGTAYNFTSADPTLSYNTFMQAGYFQGKALATQQNNVGLVFNNLYADLSQATASTVNELRTAFQIQRLLERSARSGTRYVEILRSFFGVTSPDSRLQRPEYLGGNRFPFNVQQVTQTSSTDAVTPQGNLAGFSVTSDVNHDFVKGFTEHGWIIGLACARYQHSYQQGLDRFWSRRQRFDWYWPTLAFLGEMAVKNREIYAQGTSADDEVFGYQEAWADYRYMPNKVTGQMRSSANGSLDTWHYADDYQSQPYLSSGWIPEQKSNVDRTLAVSSAVSNQIFGDFYFDIKATRVMPAYSVPGLIDHF